MTDLHKKLEAAGRKEAEEYFKAKMPHLWKEYELDLERSHTMKSYLECHRSLHPLILKVAEALEEIGNKEWVQGSSVKKICTETLAELEKYLEGKK